MSQPLPPMSQDIPISRQRVLLSDFKAALLQQMFFWGRDVMTSGNLLIQHGFIKLPSPGLKGTSCYRLDYRGGIIELHGACAGWYPGAHDPQPGFLFVRTSGRCTSHQLHEPVIPGCYQPEVLSHDTASTMKGAQVFATWLADYEDWILACQGADYRSQCRHMLGRLPKGSPWLPAPQATKWLRALAQQGGAAPRAKIMFHGTSGHNPTRHAPQQMIRPSRLRQEKSHAALN
jgi:hypothetical protein